MSDENVPPQRGRKRPSEDSALAPPPRKKACVLLSRYSLQHLLSLEANSGPPNYWRLKGCFVRRAFHAFANIEQIIFAGLELDKDLPLSPNNNIENCSAENRLQYSIYTMILHFLPTLEEGLRNETITPTQLNAICVSLQAGANAARSDDIKGLKVAILDWITDPVVGLTPPIHRLDMAGRGFNHKATGKELCPAGLDWEDPSIKSALQQKTMVVASDQWPIFIFANGNYDLEEPWQSLFRGRLLINAFKHIFTSPSSVEDSGRSTKASNAALHGMTTVTLSSITYVATLVRFALGTRKTLAHTDTVADSLNFYNVVLAFLSHPDERENTNDLIRWWNKRVFPHAVVLCRAPTTNSALAKLMQARKKRVALRAIAGANGAE